MTEVQLLCASEKELVTHRKPSLSRNISSFTLAVLLLNLLQTQSGNEAVAIHFSFSSSRPAEETASIFLKHKCCNTNKCFASVAIFSSAILVVSFLVKLKMWNVYSTFFTRECFIFFIRTVEFAIYMPLADPMWNFLFIEWLIFDQFQFLHLSILVLLWHFNQTLVHHRLKEWLKIHWMII